MKRYALMKFVNRGGTADAKMEPREDGPWVKAEDVDAVILELEEWKQKAVEFNEAYLDESRKLTAYLFSDANDVGFWKRLLRRR